MTHDIEPVSIHPIVRQIIDRDCHVGWSDRRVIRQVISKLRHIRATYRGLPQEERRALLRQCVAHHRRNQREYAVVRDGWTPPSLEKEAQS